MRLQAVTNLETKNGRVAILDDLVLGPVFSGPRISCEGPPGKYKLWAGSDFIVVDFAPRSLRAGSRSDLDHVGSLTVQGTSVVVVDADALPDEVKSSPQVFITQLPLSSLVVWMEEKEMSSAVGFPRILCVGPQPRLLMAGPNGDKVHEIERKSARFFRAKGKEKASLRDEIEEDVRELALSGSRDQRLLRIAKLVGIKVPRIRRKKAK